jgi:hypothetical protein
MKAKGGAGHVGENAYEVKPIGRRVAHEAVIAEKPAIARQGLPDGLGRAPVLGQRLGNRGERQEGGKPDGHERPEDRRPVRHPQDLAAHSRSDERSHRHHGHQRGENARGASAVVEVAHHGAGQDDAGARTEGLHYPPEDELACGHGERATRSAQHEDDEPQRHRAAPP